MYLCITNRKLCQDDFMERIRELGYRRDIEKIILREKDLSTAEYGAMAAKCQEICRDTGMPLVVNTFVQAAEYLGLPEVQVSFPLMEQNKGIFEKFPTVGVSVHSLGEARAAQEAGASYLIAGHIFPTDCKRGVPARGLGFLRDICAETAIPVYAIGGISPANLPQVLAAGGCMMSGFMRG